MVSERDREWRRGSAWRGFIVLSILAVSSPAAADPTAADKETARSLMEKGDDAFRSKQYDKALKAYAAADSIMHLPSTGIAVAKTEAALGRLLQARDKALEVTRLPKTDREREPLLRARRDAEALADSLATRIPAVEVRVSGPAEEAMTEVAIDDERLAPESLSAARKVNPGKHTVTARAAGFRPAAAEVVVSEGDHAIVRLHLDRVDLEPVATTPSSGSTSAATSPNTLARPSRPGVAYRRTGPSAPTYVAFALAGVGVATGTVTGILSLTRASSARDQCVDNACPPAAESDIDASRGFAWASNIAFGVAVAMTALGFIGLITSSRPAATHRGAAPSGR